MACLWENAHTRSPTAGTHSGHENIGTKRGPKGYDHLRWSPWVASVADDAMTRRENDSTFARDPGAGAQIFKVYLDVSRLEVALEVHGLKSTTVGPVSVGPAQWLVLVGAHHHHQMEEVSRAPTYRIACTAIRSRRLMISRDSSFGVSRPTRLPRRRHSNKEHSQRPAFSRI